MSDSNSVSQLTKLASNAPVDTSAVEYRSHGRVLIVSNGQLDSAALEASGIAARIVVAAGPEAPWDQTAGGTAVRRVPARVIELRGWLGQFVPAWSTAGGDPPSGGVSGGDNEQFDVVIDLSDPPLIDRSVFPIGYFAPRDRQQLADALAQAADLVGRFSKQKYFRYDAEICVHQSFGQTGCTRCLEVCAADAIRSDGDRIAVEPQLCQGCAACTLACPTGALSYAGADRADLLAQLDDALGAAHGAAPVVLAGQLDTPLPAPERDWIVEFPVQPLAAFGEELWFGALARGARRVVLLADAAIPAETRQLLDQRVATARTILEACGQPADGIALAEHRAQAFELIRGDPVQPVPSPDDPSAHAALPTETKRALLTGALARLETTRRFEPAPLPAGAPLGTLLIDRDRCTLCSACAKICPTGAVRYADEDADGQAKLGFAEDLCVQCGACARGCPEQAIALQPRIASAETRAHWRVLNAEPLADCPDCGRGFMPRKLLEANIRRMTGPQTPAAAVEQMRRCPDCRHWRIRNP